MPSKREILAHFTRDELVAVVERFELAVTDRRKKDDLVEAIAGSKKATMGEVLPELSRDRLKELCRGLGLDDSGKEKATLIERLNGSGLPKTSGAPQSSPPKANGRGTPTQQVDLNLGDKLTREKLEGYLWSAADILRGSIDSSDYKNYILGMLFLKRLSDRFDEECEALQSVKGANPEDPDEHDFFVPRKARWPELQKTASNIGEALNKACAALEDANPRTLEGVLAGIDYNDERKLGDNRNRDNVLSRLVQHFSRVNLRNSNLSEPDLLGRAYEYLIERFADDAGKKGGEFYTPKKVVELIVSILAPQAGMRICDPTAGSAGMLIACAHYVEDHKGNPKNLGLFGQEKNLGTWALSKMNLLLHNLPGARIEKGDTIRDPRLVEGGELMLFDRVIANPPFSLDDWGREVAERDPHGRFRFGVPPKSYGEFAFIQHMLATACITGLVGVVVPHGVLFRGGAEGQIRKGLLSEDQIDSVVGLAPNLFFGTGIPAAILVLSRRKPNSKRGRVLFVDGSGLFGTRKAQNYLRDEDVQRIASAVNAFRDEPGLARVVPLEEVERNGWNLNVSRYIETVTETKQVSVADALTQLRECELKRHQAEVKMSEMLRSLGYAR